MAERPLCFVVMPFRPELNFFYLYLVEYMETRHNLRVVRGDSDVLTKPMMEKIAALIMEADVILADVTGNNPNVLFEIGIAYTAGKPIVFLTQDEPERAPVDIRQFEYIRYDLSKHRDLLDRIDNALKNVFLGYYKKQYERAVEILGEFRKGAAVTCAAVGMDEFRVRIIRAERAESLSERMTEEEAYNFLLPLVVDTSDIRLLKRLTESLERRFPPPP